MPHWGIRITREPEECERILREMTESQIPQLSFAIVHHHPDPDVPKKHSHGFIPLEPFASPAQAESARRAMSKQLNRKHGLKGNADFATGYYEGGFEAFAFYAKHSGDTLAVGTEEQKAQYEASPVFVKPSTLPLDEGEGDDMDRPLKRPFRSLNEFNLVKKMRQFCRLNNITIKNFNNVFKRMVRETNLRPARGAFGKEITDILRVEFEQGIQVADNNWLEYINRPSRY